MKGPVLAGRLLLGAVAVFAAFLLFSPKPWLLDPGDGEKPKFEVLVQTGLYWAAAANVVLCAILAATARWWALPVEPGVGERVRRSRWLWAGLVAAMLLGGFLRWPLAHGGMWEDEAWPLRRAIMGERVIDQKDPTRLVFKPRGWLHTFFQYGKPTNHVPFSVLSRVSLTAWRLASGRQAWEFDDFVMRLPAYVAGLVSIILVGLLLAEWGLHHGTAVAGAFLFALHPWHIRYSADARAYTMMLVFTLLGLIWLTRALRIGEWKHWLLYGLSQFLLLWSFPYGIYLTIPVAVAGVVAILAHHGWTKTALQLFLRFTVVHLFAAICVLQLVLPLLTQVPYWSEAARSVGPMKIGPFLLDFWSRVSVGYPYAATPPVGSSAPYPSALGMLSTSLGFKLTFFIILPVLATLGCLRLIVRRDAVRYLALALLVAAPFAFLCARLQNQIVYTRFFIYALVALIPFTVVGAETVALAAGRWSAYVRNAMLVLVVAGFALLAAPQHSVLLSRPLSSAREAARFIAAQGDSALAVGMGNMAFLGTVYNPWQTTVTTEKELAELCRRSVAEGKPLYISYIKSTGSGLRLPKRMVYETVQTFDTIEPTGFHRVVRYTGTSSSRPAEELTDPVEPSANEGE